jgi:hypothetical protein
MFGGYSFDNSNAFIIPSVGAASHVAGSVLLGRW